MADTAEQLQDIGVKTETFAAAIQGFAYSPSSSRKQAAPPPQSPATVRLTRSKTRADPDSPSTSSHLTAVKSASAVHRTASSIPTSLKPSPTSSIGKELSRKRKASAPLALAPPESSSATKKRKKSSGYAPPSTYAHIPNLLKDALQPGLICVFIGVNPGLRTATTGHAYSHPSNNFWKFLYSSGCTPRLCKPSETHALTELYGLGNTNIVERATKNAAELSKQEMDAGVEHLESKVRECKPESVAIVGKGIWESIWRVRHGKKITTEQFKYGWQDQSESMGKPEAGNEEDDEWQGARVFVATTTSGLAAGMRPHEKEAIWRPFGQWVKQRREAKGLVGDRKLVNGVVVSDGLKASMSMSPTIKAEA